MLRSRDTERECTLERHHNYRGSVLREAHLKAWRGLVILAKCASFKLELCGGHNRYVTQSQIAVSQATNVRCITPGCAQERPACSGVVLSFISQ